MSNTYGIPLICIPSNKLIVDKNREEFFECMSEEELQRIQKENDRNARC